jgi:hypothetical protein
MRRFRKLSRCKTLLLPLQIHSYCLLSNAFVRPMNTFRSVLSRGILVRSCHRRSARYRDRSPTPALLGPAQRCACNAFSYDIFGDHLQTCHTKSAASQVHDWVVYKLGALLGKFIKLHRQRTRNVVTSRSKTVVMQKPQTQDNRLPPHRTLIMDYSMTHIRFGCSHLHPMGQLTRMPHGYHTCAARAVCGEFTALPHVR